jgi:hypothetical protein
MRHMLKKLQKTMEKIKVKILTPCTINPRRSNDVNEPEFIVQSCSKLTVKVKTVPSGNVTLSQPVTLFDT